MGKQSRRKKSSNKVVSNEVPKKLDLGGVSPASEARQEVVVYSREGVSEGVETTELVREELFHSLIFKVEKRAAKFSEIVRKYSGTDVGVAIHQDCFAIDYDDEEYKLLGMCIKYAGLYGVSVRILGKAGETLK